MRPQAPTRNRHKQILVAALALVLVGVLAWPAPTDSPPKGETSPDAATAARDLPTERSRKAAGATPHPAADLPRMSLDAILAADPFVSPTPVAAQVADHAPAPQPEVERKTERPRLQAVYGGARGNTALVEHRILREGDELPGGSRVEKIAPHGILIRRASGG